MIASVQNYTENFKAGAGNWTLGDGWSVVGGDGNYVIKGTQLKSASDDEPLVGGGITLEPHENTIVYFDDILAEFKAPEPITVILPSPFFDGAHFGDIELTGNEILILENGRYKQYGNIILHGNAQLIIMNSTLMIERCQNLWHWGIRLENTSSLIVENSALEPGLNTLIVIEAHDRTEITMSDSPNLGVHLLGVDDHASANITNSTVVSEIGGFVGVSGNADVLIINSTIGAIGLTVGDGERLSGRGLGTGRFENWNIHRDMDTNIACNLTLINTELVPDELREGGYERGWTICVLHPSANVSIMDSQLRRLILTLSDEDAEFRDLLIDEPIDFSYRDVSLRNVTVRGQWGIHLRNSNITIRDSEALFIIVWGNSNLTLINSTLNEFDPTDFHGTINFDKARRTVYSGITFNNDFIIRGSIETLAGPGAEKWREGVPWQDSNVTRFYEVIGRPDMNLTLRKNGTEVWSGRTDSEGRSEFNIRFDDENYRDVWSLSDGIRTIDVDFFTDTPIDLREPTAAPTPVSSPTSEESMHQGFSPFAIAITKDGKYAYVCFDLSEIIFKIRLTNFTVEAVVDLSRYFPIESEHIALDASEEKLFVHSAMWRKLLVLDVQTMNVTHTIDDIGEGIVRSEYGPFLITWDGGNVVKFVNTETYEVIEFTDERIGFLKIQESEHDQDKWHVVTQRGPEGPWVVGIYDYKAKAWRHNVSFPLQPGEYLADFKVLPNEQKAYLAIMGGWYPEYHAYGWLYSVDLKGGEVKVIPVDGGALCLEASSDSQRLYVGTGWPMPSVNNLLIVDTQSDNIIGQISLGQNEYGWYYTQMNDLQIDPANPHIFYATSTDGNAFIKVNLNSLNLTDVLVLNEESFRPNFFVKGPMQTTGYILIHQSRHAFELDLDKAIIRNVVAFPAICADFHSYDVAIDNTGRLLIAHGDSILEVDPQDMRLLGTHPLPPGIPAVSHFILSNDKTKLYAISDEYGTKGEYHPEVFLAINTATFQEEACFRLEGGTFEERPFELPDGSKLYALGGLQNGPAVIQVIRTDNLTIQKTIIFDQPGLQGISAGPYYPFAYDSSSRTLFVGVTQAVLAIDTDTDVIKKVIHLVDVAKAIGPESRPLTYINAIGMVYQPEENYLYIAHLDLSFVSIYDLNNDRFLPKVIPLKGFFPNYIFANDDHDKIYTLNTRSDSISVIDVKSKAVEKVIDLHGGWVSIRATPEEVSISVDDVQYKGGDAFEWAKGSVHAIAAPEFISLGEGERLLFSEWDDGNKSSSRSVRVTGPASYVATFKKQYYLAVISDYGSPIGSGWYDEGTTATVSLASGEVPAEFPYANFFVGWGGDAQGNYPASSIPMDGPKTIIARWERRLSSSFYSLLGSMSFGMALVALFLLLRKFRKRKGLRRVMEVH